MKKRIKLEKDCLDCKKYLSCEDPDKAVNFVCKRFKERKSLELADVFTFGASYSGSDSGLDEIDMSDVEGEGKKKQSDVRLDLDHKINVSDLINSVLTSDLLTPVDTKIDDSPVPMAKNFYEFTTGQKFLGVKPYLFQMLYITQLFSEYCPRCSDLKWMKQEAKVNDTLQLFKQKVICLEFGVCPRCGVRKSELLRTGELKYYQELAGLAGQRCVVGSSYINTKVGLKKISEIVPNSAPEGFSSFAYEILNPRFHWSETESIFISKPEKTIKATLANGLSIQGTAEHPIKTEHGYLPLALLPPEICVPLRFNFEGFGVEKAHSDQAHFYGYVLACGEGEWLRTNVKLARSVSSRVFGEELTQIDEGIKLPHNVDDAEHYLRTIRTWNKESVILFMRAFFSSQNSRLVKDETRQVVMLLLQALGLPYYLDSKTGDVCIDGDFTDIASRMFASSVPKGDRRYRHYRYDKNTYSYYVPLHSTTPGEESITYDFVVPGDEAFICNGIDNHNSGKSAIVAMCCAYLLHKQIKLQKPNEIYGLLPANVLHGTFVALTYKQAAETLWEPFLSYITDSPWFCLEENSKVELVNGVKRAIKDVRVGDEVVTAEGSSVVSKVYDNGVQNCFKLTLDNGSEIEATANHKFSKVTPNGDRVWVALSELQVGDTLEVY